MKAGFMPEPTEEAEAAWIAQLQHANPGGPDGGVDGEHPEITTSDDESTRRAHLRHLTQRYLEVAVGRDRSTAGLRSSMPGRSPGRTGRRAG
jgi:hypothetical protein